MENCCCFTVGNQLVFHDQNYIWEFLNNTGSVQLWYRNLGGYNFKTLKLLLNIPPFVADESFSKFPTGALSLLLSLVIQVFVELK